MVRGLWQFSFSFLLLSGWLLSRPREETAGDEPLIGISKGNTVLESKYLQQKCSLLLLRSSSHSSPRLPCLLGDQFQLLSGIALAGEWSLKCSQLWEFRCSTFPDLRMEMDMKRSPNLLSKTIFIRPWAASDPFQALARGKMRNWEAAREKEDRVGLGQYLTSQVLLQFSRPWVVTDLLTLVWIPRNCSFSMFPWGKEASTGWGCTSLEGSGSTRRT